MSVEIQYIFPFLFVSVPFDKISLLGFLVYILNLTSNYCFE